MKKIWVIWVVWAIGAVAVQAQSVEASIDHIEMLIGEQAHVTLKAVAKRCWPVSHRKTSRLTMASSRGRWYIR